MKEHLVNTPSGLVFKIREATGADDEVLTDMQAEGDAEVIDAYIQRLIIKGPEDKPFSTKDVEVLTLRDKYTLLLKMRILSLSEKLIFEYKWPNNPVAKEYEVDLNQFVWDYSKAVPVEGEEGYSDLRILPYAVDSLDMALKDGRKVRIDLLDGIGEKKLLKIQPAGRNINSALKSRNITIEESGKWVPVNNFAIFSARDMIEIRNYVQKFDAQITGEVEIQNPATLEVIPISILEIKDFFFPAKI